MENQPKVLEIKLKFLNWTGHLLNHQKFGEFPYLEKAEIFLDTYRSEGVCDYANIFEFLCSICKVKKLILNQRTIKTLFSQGSMDAPIFDTSYLCLQTAYLDNSLVPEMVSFMRGMSNLRVLDIKSKLLLFSLSPKACGFNAKYWKS